MSTPSPTSSNRLLAAAVAVARAAALSSKDVSCATAIEFVMSVREEFRYDRYFDLICFIVRRKN